MMLFYPSIFQPVNPYLQSFDRIEVMLVHHLDPHIFLNIYEIKLEQKSIGILNKSTEFKHLNILLIDLN